MNAPRTRPAVVISSCIHRIALICIVVFSGCATTTTNQGKTAAASPKRPPLSDEQIADAWGWGLIMGPIAIAFLPFAGVAWGIESLHFLAPAKVEEFHVPAGYHRQGADQWIASIINPIPHGAIRTTTVHKNGDELLTVKTDRTLIYARFHNGVTVEYSPQERKQR